VPQDYIENWHITVLKSALEESTDRTNSISR